MRYVYERAKVICDELLKLSAVKNDAVSNWDMKESFFIDPKEADSDKKTKWKKFDSNSDLWGGFDTHAWFRTKFTISKEHNGCELRLSFETELNGWDAANPQFLLFINGAPIQGLDVNHRDVCLDGFPDEITLDLQAYSGRVTTEKVHLKAHSIVYDREISKLYFDLLTLNRVIAELRVDEKPRVDLEITMTEVINLIDLRKPFSKEFYKSVKKASAYFDSTVYNLPGKSDVVATCVGHTHIDVAWLWTVAQTREKTARSFSGMLKLMDEYPEFKFMSSQPQLYKFLKEWYPELYDKVKTRIKDGRWEAEGGMWLEADCNVISGESMVRQFLYGKKFFKDEFGVENEILWLPDVFGYSAALPQIMKKSGIKYFMTTKIAWNQFNKLPHDTFWWKGIDGSEIFTHLVTTADPGHERGSIRTTYNGSLVPFALINGWNRYQQKEINNDILVSFGFGDGGGGSTRENIETGRRLQKGIPGSPVVRFETSKKYFDELYDRVSDNKRLPKWVGELYLEYHRGTYTSMARNKRSNRKLEILLQEMEFFSLWAEKFGLKYPQKQLDEYWEIVLRNQFHDILPGSSIKEVYDVTKVEYDEMEAESLKCINKALGIIAGNIKGANGIAVFNSLSFDRTDLLILDKSYQFKSIKDEDGTALPVQTLYDGGKAVYVEDVPSKGVKRLAFSDEVSALANEFVIDDFSIETYYYSVKFDKNGFISSLYDKDANRNVIQDGKFGNMLRVFEDKPMQYDNWDIDIYYKEKSWPCDNVTKMKWLEKGPLRAVLYIEKTTGDSVIKQNIIFYAHSGRIDFETTVDWKENQSLLRVEFPVDLNVYEATYDIQFGNTVRPAHFNTSWDEARFEVCAHKWADMSESGYGVSILNDCKYGHSLHNGVISLTLIKSGNDPNATADREVHRFTYSLLPHLESWRDAETVQEAWKLNQPLYAVLADENLKGSEDNNLLWIDAEYDNVIAETYKKSVSGKSSILRLHEFKNCRCKVSLTLPCEKVYETDLMENRIKVIPVSDGEFEFEIMPYEIKTFEIL